MNNKYLSIYYHFVWSTKNRVPYITPEIEIRLFGYIRKRCKEMGVEVQALNGMPDHVHLVCSVPPTIALSDFMEIIKGSSSHLINKLPSNKHMLYWQSGYACLTVSNRHVPKVVGYVVNQKHHHQDGRLSAELERMAEQTLPQTESDSSD